MNARYQPHDAEALLRSNRRRTPYLQPLEQGSCLPGVLVVCVRRDSITCIDCVQIGSRVVDLTQTSPLVARQAHARFGYHCVRTATNERSLSAHRRFALHTVLAPRAAASLKPGSRRAD